MSRNLFLEPRDLPPLPKMDTHRQWCNWLFSRGGTHLLSPNHKQCRFHDHCVATNVALKATGQDWRYQRKEA